MESFPLTVCKASAGSGKTFTLAVEYIKLLIENPTAYRHILAVTFTNKATEEMKMRILSQLYGLSKGYSDSDDYLKKICDELGCDEDLVRTRAGIALTRIIHHYNYFRVETIDKFFQRVLRNLARELDLTANLRIELNDKQVEQQAVDMMILQLKKSDQVLNLLMNYILSNIDDDKSWNVLKNVKEFGENIFKDSYKEERERMRKIMSAPSFFDDFKTNLYRLKDRCRKEMSSIAESFFTITKGYDADDFKQKSRGVYGYFEKLRKESFDGSEASTYVRKCQESPDEWSKNPAIIALARQQLIDLLSVAEESRLRCYSYIKTADIVLSNIYQLRLLLNIEEKVRELNQDANRFLLSDTQGMLHQLIDKSDTPFIFEKTGAFLHHIMIDEFQDTGRVQWENFKILLRDCMDQGKSNLIVGDVKQSIYRWRSGDWRLLNDIKHEFSNSTHQIRIRNLDTNYRSYRRVVDFNNIFFQEAALSEYERLKEYVGVEAEELKTAYSDVEQKIPQKKDDQGYIRVELLPKADCATLMMDRIAESISRLLETGVSQNEIAILARRKEDIRDTALYFQENIPEIRIVSDEAFRLDASTALNILMTSLRVLVHPKDRLSRATLAKTYQNVILDAKIPDDHLAEKLPCKDGPDPLDNWLPADYIGEANRTRLLSRPLHELIEELYRLFRLETLQDQSAYVCTFYDQLNEFLSDNIGDAETLLEVWDETICKKNIQGENVDGIRMVTIHKSKGLEYDHVLVPFCNWTLEQGSIIWCKSDVPPFSQLPILPVYYSKKSMLGSIYEDAYKHEHLQNSVDNLNLLYVAFTRAKKSLTVIGQKRDDEKEKEQGKSKKSKSGSPSKNQNKEKDKTPQNRSELIEDCLPKVAANLPGSTLSTQEDGTLLLEYGSLPDVSVQTAVTEEKSENVFLLKEEDETFSFKSLPSKSEFLQSNQSKAFTADEEDGSDNFYIRRGTLLHSIFSRLHDINDMERVLSQLTHEGILYDEITPTELHRLLHRAFKNEQARSWFSPHWQVHNECDILFEENGEVVSRRPDRVVSDEHEIIVIDFKFGKPNEEHEKQISLYMEQLRKMSPLPVSGYLWYVFRNYIKEV